MIADPRNVAKAVIRRLWSVPDDVRFLIAYQTYSGTQAFY
jgi:hypothetical protein